MNPQPPLPPPLSLPSIPPPSAPDWRYWLRRLLVCNPFFLASAALMLFGLDKLSGDPGFLGGDETRQLLFGFFSLHAYECVVVGAALALARRRVWYDSALLAVVENGLVLVPFMMMSQAVLTGWGLTTMLALAGGALIVLRFLALRRGYPQFNLPSRALQLGAALLALNLALPVVFRRFIGEDYAVWRTPNELLWLVVLPVLAAGANLLPRPARYGGSGPERHWLPLFLYALWIGGTAVHVWCVGYVCDFRLELHQLAPLATVVGWTMFRRIGDCVPDPSWRWRAAMLLLVFGAPLFALEHAAVFHPLAALNLAGFLRLAYGASPELARAARRFALASVPLLVAGIPESALAWLPPVLAGINPLGAGVLLFIIGAAFHSREPGVGLAVAVIAGLTTGNAIPVAAPHPTIQIMAVLLAAHSLRWVTRGTSGAVALRWALAAVWFLDALAWTRHPGWEAEMITGCGAALVAVLTLIRWLRWKLPVPLPLLLGGVAVMVSGPLNWFVANSRPGLLVLAASLVVFVAGFLVAWTRHHWESPERTTPSE
jgi:hypothetical protein